MNLQIKDDDKPKSLQFETLYFTPYAWSKLLFLRDIEDCEVGGFGVLPTLVNVIEDIQLVKQEVSSVAVDFDDEGLADYTCRMSEAGYNAAQFNRVWIHTHPGNSPSPSGTDEETFAKYLPCKPFSIMYILAKGGQQYCRMKIESSPIDANGATVSMSSLLKTDIYYELDFPASNREAWEAEYRSLVSEKSYITYSYKGSTLATGGSLSNIKDSDDIWNESFQGKDILDFNIYWKDKGSLIPIPHDRIVSIHKKWKDDGVDYTAVLKDGYIVKFKSWYTSDGAPSFGSYKAIKVIAAKSDKTQKAKKRKGKKKDAEAEHDAKSYVESLDDNELAELMNSSASYGDTVTYQLCEEEYYNRGLHYAYQS